MQRFLFQLGDAVTSDDLCYMQIGWVTGPEYLIQAIAKAHQFMVFTVASNLQRAVAYGLSHEASFFMYVIFTA